MGRVLGDQQQQAGRIGGLAGDRDVRLLFQQQAQRIAHAGLIVGDEQVQWRQVRHRGPHISPVVMNSSW
jgi:hypothetical protein